MANQTSPETDLKPALEILSTKLEVISSRIDTVSSKVDAASAKADLPREQKQPWWTTLTAILGIPGLIFLMYLQFSQGGQAKADTQKSIAETQKIRTEELKARTELQAELDTLAEKKSQGIVSYQKQLNESIPKLEQTIEKLNAVNQAARQQMDRDLLVKFVLLWIFVWGIGLALDLLSTVWNSAITIPLAVFYSRAEWKSKFLRRLQDLVRLIVPILSPVPQILRIAVQIFVFFALFAPLFDQVAATTGSPIKFQSVAHSVKSLRLGEAVGEVRKMLFP
jgi:hypothetical protein